MKAFVVALLLLVAMPAPARAEMADVYAGLSLVPGLGQTAEGHPFEGLAWFIGVVGLEFTHGYGPGIGFDLWLYNFYDAYRHGAPKDHKYGDQTLFANWLGSINPYNLLDPIGIPVVGLGALAGSGGGYPNLRSPAAIFSFTFVGLGEEAAFRGFLFPTLSTTMRSDWAGAITSSAVFSAAHRLSDPDALEPSPFLVRFGLGMLFCWQTHRDKYDLRDNIFAHTWYDVLVAGNKVDGLAIRVPIYF